MSFTNCVLRSGWAVRVTTFLLCALLPVSLVLPLHAAKTSIDYFDTPEHVYAGDMVKLEFGTGKVLGSQFNYTVHGDFKLSYGDLVALADYLGDSSKPISQGKTVEDRESRFRNLENIINTGEYFEKVWGVIQSQKDVVSKAMKAGKNIADVLHASATKYSVEYALATHLHYIPLVMHDFDHFQENAILAYQAGHAVAIEHAIEGYSILHEKPGNNMAVTHAIQACHNTDRSQYHACLQQSAMDMLNLAYAENAIANHYLSDRFSSGHIRDPYYAVYHSVTIDKIDGALSGKIMHDEDCKNGVIVRNGNGQQWIAYGDAYYFSPQNKINRQYLQDTMQLSADEVYAAYFTGKDQDPKSALVMAKIPYPLPPRTTFQNKTQSAPLFSLKGQHVYRRASTCNPYDFSSAESDWKAIEVVFVHELKCASAASQETAIIEYLKSFGKS